MKYQIKVTDEKTCFVSTPLVYLFDEKDGSTIKVDKSTLLPNPNSFVRDMGFLYSLLIPKEGWVEFDELLPSLTKITYQNQYDMEKVKQAFAWYANPNPVEELDFAPYVIETSYRDIPHYSKGVRIETYLIISHNFRKEVFNGESPSLFQYSLEKSEGSSLFEKQDGSISLEYYHSGPINDQLTEKILRINSKINQFRFGGYLKDFNILDYVTDPT